MDDNTIADAVSEPFCHATVWEAVKSVPNAQIWQNALERTGLNLIMDTAGYKGTILIVQDDGLISCNSTSVYDAEVWPQGDCGTRQRDWSLFLTMGSLAEASNLNGGNSLLMYHWLPGVGGENRVVGQPGESYPTLLDSLREPAGYEAASASSWSGSDLRLQFLELGVVSLPEGTTAVSLADNYVGGYANASIVDEREVCGQGPLVRVLDRTLYPTGLPDLYATDIPELNGFCHESVYTGMQAAGKLKLPARLALSSFVHPFLDPMSNPLANLTVFAPAFEGELDLIAAGIIPGSRSQIKDLVGVYPLLGIIPGGYCPSDFGTEGLVLQSVAGIYADKNLSLLIKQTEANPNVLDIEVLYGVREKFQAEYIGKFCHSTAYRISDLITPWRNSTDPSFVDGLPLELTGQLPLVTSHDSMFGVADTCDFGNMVEYVSEYGNDEQFGFDSTSSTDLADSTDTSGLVGSSLSAGAVVGIVVAACLVLGLIILFLLWLRYQKQFIVFFWSPPASETGKGLHTAGSAPSDSSTSPSSNSSGSDHGFAHPITLSGFTEDDLILKESEVSIDKDPESGKAIVLGKGRFGRVFAGTLLGSERVAIKCISESALHYQDSSDDSDSGSGVFAVTDSFDDRNVAQNAKPLTASGSFADMNRDQILKEISLLKSCHSQYIVSFIGAMFRSQEVRLVTELMSGGDLWNALGHGAAPRTVTWYDSGIFIAMDVASGLNYLHEKKRVIHLDLKSSNILLRESKRKSPYPGSSSDRGSPPGSGPNPGTRSDSHLKYRGSYHAKVSDVGLSRILPASHEYLSSTAAGGTWNWCAPEVILNTKCTSSADMYSYGVVLWEICTGEIPVRGRMRDVRVPEECPQKIADLIHQCVCSIHDWNGGIQRRPTASAALKVLSEVLDDDRRGGLRQIPD